MQLLSLSDDNLAVLSLILAVRNTDDVHAGRKSFGGNRRLVFDLQSKAIIPKAARFPSRQESPSLPHRHPDEHTTMILSEIMVGIIANISDC